MPNPTSMEPMDSYLCVLLELNLIQANTTYQQSAICDAIANNQTDFDDIYNDPVALQAARDKYMGTAQVISVVDKREDCG